MELKAYSMGGEGYMVTDGKNTVAILGNVDIRDISGNDMREIINRFPQAEVVQGYVASGNPAATWEVKDIVKRRNTYKGYTPGPVSENQKEALKRYRDKVGTMYLQFSIPEGEMFEWYEETAKKKGLTKAMMAKKVMRKYWEENKTKPIEEVNI